MDEEFLMKCVVDTQTRTCYLYANEGDKKEVVRDNVEQFMKGLKWVSATCPEDR